MNQLEKSFLGRGWSFPPEFDPKTNSVVMVSEEEDIRQSIRIILSTLPGERLMHPEFGCDLHSQVFAGISSGTLATISDLISTAILNYEPRVTLEDITFNDDGALEGQIFVELEYTIRKINVRTNMVYPFYLIEGTNIDQDLL